MGAPTAGVTARAVTAEDARAALQAFESMGAAKYGAHVAQQAQLENSARGNAKGAAKQPQASPGGRKAACCRRTPKGDSAAWSPLTIALVVGGGLAVAGGVLWLLQRFLTVRPRPGRPLREASSALGSSGTATTPQGASLWSAMGKLGMASTAAPPPILAVVVAAPGCRRSAEVTVRTCMQLAFPSRCKVVIVEWGSAGATQVPLHVTLLRGGAPSSATAGTMPPMQSAEARARAAVQGAVHWRAVAAAAASVRPEAPTVEYVHISGRDEGDSWAAQALQAVQYASGSTGPGVVYTAVLSHGLMVPAAWDAAVHMGASGVAHLQAQLSVGRQKQWLLALRAGPPTTDTESSGAVASLLQSSAWSQGSTAVTAWRGALEKACDALRTRTPAKNGGGAHPTEWGSRPVRLRGTTCVPPGMPMPQLGTLVLHPASPREHNLMLSWGDMPCAPVPTSPHAAAAALACVTLVPLDCVCGPVAAVCAALLGAKEAHTVHIPHAVGSAIACVARGVVPYTPTWMSCRRTHTQRCDPAAPLSERLLLDTAPPQWLQAVGRAAIAAPMPQVDTDRARGGFLSRGYLRALGVPEDLVEEAASWDAAAKCGTSAAAKASQWLGSN